MPPKKNSNTTMINWEKQMAEEAIVAAAMEANVGGGKFFSLKAGVLSFGGAPVPGNQMGVVILDHILENVYYGGEYDESKPQGPACFAFGRDEDSLAPHKVAVDAQSAQGSEEGTCKGCPMNEWGTASKGKGKACRNTRRLAMIMAGQFDSKGVFVMETDPEQYKTADIAYMRLPVTSVKGFATWVKQLSEVLRRPPRGVVAKVRVVPDLKSQFRVVFESLESIPNELMQVITDRAKEAKSAIDFPYAPFEENVEPAPRQSNRGAAVPAGRRQGPATTVQAQRPAPARPAGKARY